MQNSYKSMCAQSYKEGQSFQALSTQSKQLEFFLIQATTGEMVCCSLMRSIYAFMFSTLEFYFVIG